MLKTTLNPKLKKLFEPASRAGFSFFWNLPVEESVSSQRSSSVSVVTLPVRIQNAAGGSTQRAYLKKYWYPSIPSRLKGFCRNTFFGMSRASREYCSLSLLNEIGCSLVRPIAVGEDRSLRLLRRAFILTEEIPGTTSLDQIIFSPDLDTRPVDERRELAAGLGCWVRAMHDRGFRDRDLHPRNILIHSIGKRWAFSKIDSGAGSGGRKPPGSRRVDLRDLADLDEGARTRTTRQDRLRFLLAYLAAPRIDAEVRFIVSRLASYSLR